MAPDSSVWSICYQARPAARVRLLCFPYAGGNAQTYRRWHQLLPPSIEVHAAQLPGRMPRLSETPLTSIAALVNSVAPVIATWPRDKPLVLFGHSMGAIVAFETARALSAFGLNIAHLAVSARTAPHLKQRRRLIHQLSNADFIGELRDMGGTPDEVLRDDEMMALVLPALRSDFTAIETYRPLTTKALSCNISVFGGDSDAAVLVDDLLPWQDHTQGMALVEMLPGGHFFIDENPEPLLRTLARDCAHF